MRRLPRWLLFTVVVVVITLGALTSVVVATGRRSFPTASGELAVPGLTAPVEVLRDAYGVPNLYADNAEDLFEAQGYVHAQDRFFEMDVRRHIGAGRLSELFGASQVGADTYIRTLGWRRVAEQELPLLSATTRRYLDAYASGVNAYLRSQTTADLSLEYSVLGLQGLDYRPEDWTAVDSLTWLKVMAWDQSGDLDEEAGNALAIAAVGEQRAAQLIPDRLDGYEPIVTRGSVRSGVFDPEAGGGSRRPAPKGLGLDEIRAAAPALRAAAGARTAIPRTVGDPSSGATGSNSWVVSGSRTESGKPILSNDPHLPTSIPSVFTQVGLHCRTVSAQCPFEVSGFGFAGVPGVIFGHNARISWGITNSYADVQDLYLEQLQGDTARVGQSFQPLSVRTEEIRVFGEDQPRTVTVRASRHGPLLSDADPNWLGDLAQRRSVAAGGTAYGVALAWSALTPGRTMDAVFAINRAQDFTQFRSGAALLAAPSLNLVYADVAGTIGYQLTGRIPLRGKGDGLQVNPGWDAAYDWTGVIPTAALPYEKNPPRGYIVTANNQIIGSGYPYRLDAGASYGWRSQQIVDRLRRIDKLSVAGSQQVQADDTARYAAGLVPRLLRIRVDDAWVREGQQTLLGWDYTMSADSAAAAYYAVVVHNVLERTFRDELPENLWPSMDDRWFAVLDQLLDDPNDPWWDDRATDGVVETRDDILLAAMTDARKELTSLISRDTSGWSWGRIHRVTLQNQTLGTSGISAVEKLFNRGDESVDGADATVNAMGFDDRTSYRVTYAPAMRMTVDLGDLDASVWVNQSGASGHAFHPNYADQLELWATNRTWPFVSSRAAVEAATTHTLTLRPGG